MFGSSICTHVNVAGLYPKSINVSLPDAFVLLVKMGIGFAVNLLYSNSFIYSFFIQIYILSNLCCYVGKRGIRSKCVFGGKTRCPRLDEPLIAFPCIKTQGWNAVKVVKGS